jgi:hypothetical protein
MMEEQRALDRQQREARGQQADEGRSLLDPAAPGMWGGEDQARETGEREAREAEYERQVQRGVAEGDAPRRSADADRPVPELPAPIGQGREDRQRHEGRARGAEEPLPARGATPPGADQQRHRERHGQQLDQDRGGRKGAGERRPGRVPAGRAPGGECHEPERDRRHVGAHHGGPVDDRGRQPHEQGGDAAGRRPGEGADDGRRRQDPSEGEKQDGRPYQCGIASRHRGGTAQGDEEERRLRGEDVGTQLGSAAERVGAREVDALVELGRGDAETPARGRAHQGEGEREARDLGDARRGEEPRARRHRRRGYRRPGLLVAIAARGCRT